MGPYVLFRFDARVAIKVSLSGVRRHPWDGPASGPRGVYSSPAGSADAGSHHYAVAGRDDRGDVPVVVGDELVMLEDRVGPFDTAVVGVPLDHAPGPQHVVAQVEAADADALTRRAPGIRVPVLVDVVVDDVEVALGGVQVLH